VDRLVVEKAKRELRLSVDDDVVKTYHVSIVSHNQESNFHRSLDISYPSPMDRERSSKVGCSPGGDIVIHGLPNELEWLGRLGRLHRIHSRWTDGCIAVSNGEIEDLLRAVQDGTQVEILP
jgi:murein L,D-transpeptidase YafK